jgi:hypothetical protein
MKIFKQLSTIFAIVILLTSFSFSYAATTSVVNTKGAQKAVLVATVNIQDAKIVSQKDSTLDISFNLTNRVGVQTGVKYSVELLAKQGKGYIVIDRKIYEETLALSENTKIAKEIAYTAPANIDGTYIVRISSSTTSGILLAGATLGEIKFKGTTLSSIRIVPESCILKTINDPKFKGKEKETTLAQTAIVLGAQTLKIDCNVESSLNTPLTVTPYFQTTYRTPYGEQIKVQGGDTAPIEFKANEKKTISLALPKPGKPQEYNVGFVLAAKDIVSNTVSAQYVLLGLSASVDNATLDKDFYKKGDTANLSILWQSTLRTLPLSIESVLTDDKGKACAAPVSTSATLKDLNPIVLVPLSITHACFNPHIQVTIKDANNKVLDDRTFSFVTTSTKRPVTTLPFIIGFVLIAFVAAVIVLKNKKGKIVGINKEAK